MCEVSYTIGSRKTICVSVSDTEFSVLSRMVYTEAIPMNIIPPNSSNAFQSRRPFRTRKIKNRAYATIGALDKKLIEPQVDIAKPRTKHAHRKVLLSGAKKTVKASAGRMTLTTL